MTHEVVTHSEQLNELGKALSQAQAEIQTPIAGEENNFFNSKYADLTEYLFVIRQTFPRFGLSLIQLPCTQVIDGVLYGGVATTILHDSGQWITTSAFLPVPTHEIRENRKTGETYQVSLNISQQFGTITTYLKRYGAGGAAAIFQEQDPDGNIGTNNAPRYQQPAADKQPDPASLHPDAPEMQNHDAIFDEIEDLVKQLGQEPSVWYDYAEANEWPPEKQLAHLRESVAKAKGAQ